MGNLKQPEAKTQLQFFLSEVVTEAGTVPSEIVDKLDKPSPSSLLEVGGSSSAVEFSELLRRPGTAAAGSSARYEDRTTVELLKKLVLAEVYRDEILELEQSRQKLEKR